MQVKRSIFAAVTFILMVALLLFGLNPLLAGTITMAIIMLGYIAISYRRSMKRLNLLEEACDPAAFVEITEKQMTITGKNPKYAAYLNIDKAVGFIEMGEFIKAKELLLAIDKSRLSHKNGTLLAYTINLITCLYELGEISDAEKLYETQITVLPAVNPRMVLAVKSLAAERYFFLNRYEESKAQFTQLLKEKLSKRQYLSTLFRLAQLDEKAGDITAAKEKYSKVASQGNKLYIAKQAGNIIENSTMQ